MNLIQQVTSDPSQKQSLILPDGSSFTMTMYFSLLQTGWFITELVYGDLTLNGIRITVSPNILRQFRNQLPFGLACYANNVSREPTQQQDFSSGAFSLYTLTAAEVTEYEALLGGQ